MDRRQRKPPINNQIGGTMSHKHVLTLTAIAALLLAGCAGISPEALESEQQAMQANIARWQNQPIEKFLKLHQEPRETMDIGGGKVRLTLHYTPIDKNYEYSRFYDLYFYVSEDGIIYNTDLRRMSRTRTRTNTTPMLTASRSTISRTTQPTSSPKK